MSEAWEGDNPNPRNRTTLPWLMTTGLALLVGFYAGLTSSQVMSEPAPALAEVHPLPKPPNLLDPQAVPPLQRVPANPGTEAESAAAKRSPTPAAAKWLRPTVSWSRVNPKSRSNGPVIITCPFLLSFVITNVRYFSSISCLITW